MEYEKMFYILNKVEEHTNSAYECIKRYIKLAIQGSLHGKYYTDDPIKIEVKKTDGSYDNVLVQEFSVNIEGDICGSYDGESYAECFWSSQSLLLVFKTIREELMDSY